jgi:hypothetical protein
MSGGVRSVGVVAKEAREVLAELAAADLPALTDGEVTQLVVLAGEVAKLADAVFVQAVGRLGVLRAWEDSGARSAGTFVSWQCGMSRGRASSALSCARVLRVLPATHAAFLAGELTVEHVRLLARARKANPEAFAVDEARLVRLAGEMLFRRYEVGIRYWIDVNSADDAEADAAKRYAERRLDHSRILDGCVVIDALLDPVTGAIVARELERLETELFEQDWAEARQRLGDTATVADLRRHPKQRRADALRVMAERSAAKPPGATEARVLVHVLAGDDSVTRMCELSDGTVVTPGEVLPHLDRADVERALFDGPSKVIDIGVRRRLFTGATRTAIQLRDRVCTHPSCDWPAEDCEIDHITPYEHGGETTQANGRCLCAYHHRWRHRNSTRRRPQPVA